MRLINHRDMKKYVEVKVRLHIFLNSEQGDTSGEQLYLRYIWIGGELCGLRSLCGNYEEQKYLYHRRKYNFVSSSTFQ
jgi:hypothetical protein